MKVFLTILFLALVLALPAMATLNQSSMFPTNVRIDSTVSLTAAKPAHVICYNNDAEWDSRVRVVYNNTYSGAQIQAFTFLNSNQTEVGPYVCRTVFYALRVGQSRVSLWALGRATDVLAHEPQHMFGIYDEANAESCARRFMPVVVHNLFGVAYHTPRMRIIISAALSYSLALPPNYQGGTCPR